MKSQYKQDIFSLPIDQFSRQKWAYKFTKQIKPRGSITILDVGGYKGKTALFHSKDKVTICDLFNVNEPNYVKGDGRKLPFKDKTFDFAVCFDTYEHIPREGRKNFISELSRVSKEGAILAAPFDNEVGSVSKAETSLNDYYKDLYNKDHPWLKEHIEYKIPDRKEIEHILEKLDLSFINLPTNSLDIWVLMQTIYFSIDLDVDLRGRVDDINRYYNHRLTKLDIIPDDQAYRQIYFISNNQQHVKGITSLIKKEKAITDKHEKVRFISYALSVFGLKYRDIENHDHYLEGEVARLKKENEHLATKVRKFERITTLHRRIRSNLHKNNNP